MEEQEGFSNLLGSFLYGLNSSDFAMPFGLLLWLLLLTASLKGVDCTSGIVVAMYTAFCSAAGVLLVIIMPQQFTGALTFRTQFVLFCMFCACSIGRAILQIKRDDIRHSRVRE